MINEKLNIRLKIQVYNKDKGFGPGMADIMRLVKEEESLISACKQMGLSSSKAWKIINLAQSDLQLDFFQSSCGGKNGGYTKLSPEGEIFLQKYELLKKRLEKYAEEQVREIFGETSFPDN